MDHLPSLLVLGCSQRKRPDLGLIPAIDRYQGPPFQVVRKYLRTRPERAASLDIVILSARYGLLAPTTPIAKYDLRMTAHQAAALQPSVLACLAEMLACKRYQRLCLALGRDYLAAVAGVEALMGDGCQATALHGSQGQRLTGLHRWLYGDEPAQQEVKVTPRSRVQIRGVALALTPAQILAQARQLLADQPAAAVHVHTWVVDIDGQRVGVKWLVSQISGLPLSRFTTTEARRVLTALGIEVCSR